MQSRVLKLSSRFNQTAWLVSLILLGFSCSHEVPSIERNGLPAGWPPISEVEDNPYNGARAALGKELFFETKLSAQGNVSCGTCHQPDRAWTVSEALVMGTEGTRFFRHPPSLLNVAFFNEWHWDGGTTSLEKQVLAPLENPDEMNIRIDTLVERLNNDAHYIKRFREVFDRRPDMYGVTRAFSAYQRSLLSFSSRWDQAQKGSIQLNDQEKRGEALFFSPQLKCSQCHTPPLFTDLNYHNTGIWEWGDFDPGRARVTLDSLDLGKFKTPTLRNLSFTAPYFHNGSLNSLEEVLKHYAQGGNHNLNQDSLLAGFELNERDQTDLLSFMRTLNDSAAIKNVSIRP